MPPEEQDPAFLWDMRQAAEKIKRGELRAVKTLGNP